MARTSRPRRTVDQVLFPWRPDWDGALNTAMELMAIEGPSGREGAVAAYIERRLLEAGASAKRLQRDAANRRTPIAGDTGNLVFRLPGRRKAPGRLFTAHMDTVPLCVGSRPVLRDGFVRSADPTVALGADDRAGVAVLLHTAIELLAHRADHPPLTFCWFIQEEIGLHGARCVRRGLLGRPSLTFNFDGGAPDKLTVAATGGYRMQATIRGRASHAGERPEEGVSAIAAAALAVAELVETGWHGAICKAGRRGTSNVGVIRGGRATNVVADEAVLEIEARSHDPAFRRQIAARIEDALRRAARRVVNTAGASAEAIVRGRLDYESFRLAEDDPSVVAAEAAVRRVGRRPQRATSNGGLDANWLVRHGLPAVSLGAGQIGQHTLAEALSVADFQDACRIALVLALGAEGKAHARQRAGGGEPAENPLC